MIAALYVEPNGPYAGLTDVDPWDEARDARLYAGPWPVVAHPPCARWCQLAGLVQHRYPNLRVGADGGCFGAALAAVRRWGGVLEHPAFTLAWPAHGLLQPPAFGWARDFDGGWVCEVSQAAYGHRARKLTWLYYVGKTPPPPLDWRRPRHSARISWCDDHKNATVEIMGKRERSATPLPFRDLLLSIARSASVTPPPRP